MDDQEVKKVIGCIMTQIKKGVVAYHLTDFLPNTLTIAQLDKWEEKSKEALCILKHMWARELYEEKEISKEAFDFLMLPGFLTRFQITSAQMDVHRLEEKQ